MLNFIVFQIKILLNFNLFYRARKCSSPSSLNGGLPCFGRSIETMECLNKPNLNNSMTKLNNDTYINPICFFIDNIKLSEKFINL